MSISAENYYQAGIFKTLLPCAVNKFRRSLGLLRRAPAVVAASVVLPADAPALYSPAVRTTAPGSLWVGELQVGPDSAAGLGGHPDIRY